jgi:acetolactate synthase-1/2/3 large subunit
MLTTWRAADVLPDDHPLFFGRPGSLAPKYANLIVQNATHLEVVGARLDLPSVGYQPDLFAPNAIRCEIDEGVPCDEWIEQCNRWKAQYPIVKSEYRHGEYINQYLFIDELSEILDKDDVIVVGSSGQASDVFYPTFRVKEGQRIISSPGLGAMGFAIPAAIGAALASGRRVICIEGDGSFELNAQELATIDRMKLNIIIYILHNGGYATIRNTSKRHFNGRDHTSGVTFNHYDRPYIHSAVRRHHVYCDPDLELSPRLHSTIVDGKIIPGRLEDVS